MRALAKIGATLTVAASLGGCAYVTAIPVQPGSSESGIRIYDVKPLLVIAPSNVSVVIVPNYNRAYALRFGSFLAKHDFTADLQNGMIAHLESKQDTTAVPIAILNLITEAAKAAGSLGKAFAADAQTSGGRLQVFDIIFDTSGNLVELKPLISASSLIDIPMAPTFIGVTPTPATTPAKSSAATPIGSANTTTAIPGGQTGAPSTTPRGSITSVIPSRNSVKKNGGKQ